MDVNHDPVVSLAMLEEIVIDARVVLAANAEAHALPHLVHDPAHLVAYVFGGNVEAHGLVATADVIAHAGG